MIKTVKIFCTMKQSIKSRNKLRCLRKFKYGENGILNQGESIFLMVFGQMNIHLDKKKLDLQSSVH